ncbi:MAG: DUF1553 domain-containing protein [Planctomycetaceae bacterium]|nr:DUF1553 domain-containing protein [Planctomycetaceae bacterium]
MLVLCVSILSRGLSAEVPDFDQDILPILETYCIDCHGPDTAESMFRMDSELHALRGGDSGEKAVVPGNSSVSYLIERIQQKDPSQRMPPDSNPLPEIAVSVLRQWIDDKDRWREMELQLESEGLDHWSLQPVKQPTPPSQSGHPIDSFVHQKFRDMGLPSSPPAERRKRIRRLFLVMHGLPPQEDQIQSFETDTREDAWDQLVEDVLASPRYGERWAAHWLDLVRFGETHGFETNRERPHAWHYRDWVIKSLNDDKPYDQFILEQLAGDALGADVGTGFLVAGPYDLVKGQDPQLRLMQRQDELADMINATGTAFLGLTLGCARCHNHKFDPVTQTDYYSLQAVFAGVQHADRPLSLPDSEQSRIAELDQEIASLWDKLSEFFRPAVTATLNEEKFEPTEVRFVRFTMDETNQSQPCIDELEVFSADQNVALASLGTQASSNGDFQHPLHKLEHINDGKYGNARSWIAAKPTGGWVQLEFPELRLIDRIVWARDREGRYADRLAISYQIEGSRDGQAWQLLSSSADRLPFQQKADVAPDFDFSGVPDQQAQQGRKWLSRLKSLLEERKAVAQPPLVYAGTFQQPGPTHRLYRGEPGSPREQVVPAAIESLSDVSLSADSPEQERRLAIAKWIASDENPLTARVIVNRIWQFHFGTGIVDTPSDFGANGTPPTHPELLDWLASELIAHDWSLKHIHRLILTSETWQQDSRPHEQGMRIDADSRLLWRFPPRRLEAEGIRDCILFATGKLDLRMGGPGFSAFEVEAENVRHYHPKQDFGPEDWRRMVYMTKVRQERDAVFGVFDCPDCSQVVPKRSRSTTPLQALNLLNSRFVMQQAEFLVDRLDHEADEPSEKVSRAYQLCFGRLPDDEEVQTALAFIEDAGWVQFARAMFNANEFVFIP